MFYISKVSPLYKATISISLLLYPSSLPIHSLSLSSSLIHVQNPKTSLIFETDGIVHLLNNATVGEAMGVRSHRIECFDIN